MKILMKKITKQYYSYDENRSNVAQALEKQH